MTRAMAAEFVQQFRFDLVFELPGAGEAHRALMRRGGNRGGAAHDVEFVRILEQAHFVEQAAHVADLVWRADAAADFLLDRVAQPEDALVPGSIEAQRIKQCGLVAHQFGQFLVQLFDGIGRIETELSRCAASGP